jgi:hypothetical protein
MQRITMAKILFVAVVLSLVAVSIIYGSTQNSPHLPTVTPSPTPTITENPTSNPTEPPVETMSFQAVSVDSAHIITVQVYSTSGQNITLTKATIKDDNGNTLATDTSLNNTLPANGNKTKITLQLETVNFTSGGPYTLTLTSELGNSFTSHKIYTTSQTYLDNSGN